MFHLQSWVSFRKNENVMPLSRKQKLIVKSVRFLLTFYVPMLSMWPPWTVRELERVNIIIRRLGILSRTAHQHSPLNLIHNTGRLVLLWKYIQSFMFRKIEPSLSCCSDPTHHHLLLQRDIPYWSASLLSDSQQKSKWIFKTISWHNERAKTVTFTQKCIGGGAREIAQLGKCPPYDHEDGGVLL